MSIIDNRLIGRWYAFCEGNLYAVYRGNSLTKTGELPKDAITKWFFPEGWRDSEGDITTCEYIYLNNAAVTPIITEGITFPPKDYLTDKCVTEFEILSNGDYMILE